MIGSDPTLVLDQAVVVLSAAALIAFGYLFYLRMLERQRSVAGQLSETGGTAVTFTVTKEDLWTMTRTWQAKSVVGRSMLFALMAFMAAVLIVFLIAVHRSTPRIPVLLLSIVGFFTFVLYIGFLRVLFKPIAIALVTSRPGVLGEHTISIHQRGLRERTSHNDTLWPWTDVREVTQFPTMTVIRVRGLGAFMIPNTAFPSEGAAHDFASAVRSRLARSGN